MAKDITVKVTHVETVVIDPGSLSRAFVKRAIPHIVEGGNLPEELDAWTLGELAKSETWEVTNVEISD